MYSMLSLRNLSATVVFFFLLLQFSCGGGSGSDAGSEGGGEQGGQQQLCVQPQGENILFVDVENVCGSCSDDVERDDNAINNAWCTLTHAASVVQPGDTVYLRAGVYPESVTLSVNGEDQNPITIAAYGNEDVVLEGGDVLSGWNQCSSADNCGGNPNWQNIFYAYIPQEHAAETDALIANLFQGDDLLAVAQEPDMPDSLYIDDIENYFPIALGAQTETALTDAAILGDFASGFWEDAFALLWVTHNRVEFRKIDSFDRQNSAITFAETGAPPYDDRDGKYSIYNGVQQIDNPGEYSINYQLEQDGTRKVYLWPLNGVVSNTSIRFSVRNYGIDINRKSYVTVQGLKVQRYTGSELIHGIGIGSVHQGGELNGVVIRDNEVRFNRHATRGYGGIYLSNCADCSIEDNTVYENVRHAGIFMNGPIRSKIKDNIVYRAGQTCVRFYGAQQSQIIGNDISGCSGSHANTITVYLYSEDVLIANNYIHDSLGYITLQSSTNINIYNNFVDTSKSRIAATEFGGTSNGTWIIAQNTFVSSAPSTALMLGNNGADFIVKNNILDGFCPPDGATVDRSNNLYTGLMWCQGNQYGWELEDNEVIEEDLDQIFSSPATGNYIPLGNSYAAASGADISDLLPSDIFADFRFDLDIDGNSRNMANPAMGALEP